MIYTGTTAKCCERHSVCSYGEAGKERSFDRKEENDGNWKDFVQERIMGSMEKFRVKWSTRPLDGIVWQLFLL